MSYIKQELTGLEEKILKFFIDYTNTNEGRSPTLKEVGRGCGVSSVGTIHRYMSSLEEKGAIEKVRSGWRTRIPVAQSENKDINLAGREMEVIRSTIDRAEYEGLLTEVMWTLAQSNKGSVQEKCMHALMEWDI